MRQLGIDWGVVGVHIFFALSGYLITLMLQKKYVTEQIGLGKAYFAFWVSRVFRIVPLVIAALVFLSLFEFDGKDFDFYLYNSLFLGNIYRSIYGQYLPYTGHFWTLGIEIQFYLIYPFVFWSLSEKWRPIAFLFLAFVALTIHSFLYLIPSIQSPGFMLTGRVHIFLLGALLACLPDDATRRNTALVMCVAGALPILVKSVGVKVIWPRQIDDLFYAGIVGLVAYIPIARYVLTRPLLVSLGVLSYGLYVWHLVVTVLTPYIMATYDAVGIPDFPYRRQLALLVITLLFASLSWKYLEEPLIRLGHSLAGRILQSKGPANRGTAMLKKVR